MPPPDPTQDASRRPPLAGDEHLTAPTASEDTPAAGPASAPAHASADSGGYPFLVPPGAAGELGRLGRYRVLGAIGRGGMGAVFRAEDPVLKRPVALKVMLPQHAANPVARHRFIREAQAQAKVEHDHVVPIFDVGEEGGVVFLAMPLLKGITLAAALKLARPPLGEVLRVGRAVAEGLAAAHDLGLVHRDIKPANVWLEGGRRRANGFGRQHPFRQPAPPRQRKWPKRRDIGTPLTCVTRLRPDH